MIWITSDWHLGHNNIIRYDNRPFDNVEEMNEELFRRCNKVVEENDTLYYLGDFAFALNGDISKIYEYRNRIQCKNIVYVLGNHDHHIRKNKKQLVEDRVFLSITDVYTIHNTKPKVFLSHYAHRVWDKSHHGIYHCFGHSHGTLPDDPNSLSIDVGVNINNYYPYSFEDIDNIMKKKRWVPKDHHNEKCF